MSYRLTNNRNKKNNYKPILIAAIIIGILFLLHNIVFKGANVVVQQIGLPIWKADNASSGFFGTVGSYFSSKTSLEKTNKMLTEQNELMRLEVTNTRQLQKENEELKKLLGRETENHKRVLGVVLTKPTFSPYDTFVIDVGASLGIAVGDYVIVAGVPIGRVAEVYPFSSLIRLYSSAGQEFQVYLGENNVEALAKGMGGNNFFLELPRETKIKEGDIVSIPSITANTFAVINKIEMKENESFQKVYFRNPVNISEIKWVEVIK